MERYKTWIKKAKSSLEISKTAASMDVDYGDLCYQSQQVVENGLTGLLIYYGVEPEFTQDIEVLLNEIEKFTEIPQDIKEAAKLTKSDNVTKRGYEESIKIANKCFEWIENKIKENEKNKK